MILTSNRAKTFDTAFKSRIQVALHYPTLDQASRYQIWENFLDMLRADSVDADFAGIATHMDELAGQEMNGRQIRNAVTTARQLAMFEKTSLGWDHLEQAVAAVGDLDKHLDSDQRRPFEGDEWIVDTASRVARSELEVLSFYPGQNVD
jgi:AAA+ superfamily predicted ATPase